MSLDQIQRDHEHCLRLAAEMLGEPARPVSLDWEVQTALKRRLLFVSRRGVGDADPIIYISDDHRGHQLYFGLEKYRLECDGRTLHVVYVSAPKSFDASEAAYDFWAVPASQYRAFYRCARQLVRAEQSDTPPILPQELQTRLWDNTVGFLQRRCAVLAKYGVAQKRGLLLLGEPGNGKTMACRWLLAECERHGLEWRSVSAEDYESYREKAEAETLFQLDRPGIVFFDDLDMALRDRDKFGDSSHHSTFLGAMDGLSPRHGVVFLFTSNANLADIDAAFRRPGRIDVVLSFPRPDAALRRRMIEELWHADVRAGIDVATAVESSAGLSFAELDELKKLLVLGYLEDERWDWSRAWGSFQRGRGGGVQRAKIGFRGSEWDENGSNSLASPVPAVSMETRGE